MWGGEEGVEHFVADGNYKARAGIDLQINTMSAVHAKFSFLSHIGTVTASSLAGHSTGVGSTPRSTFLAARNRAGDASASFYLVRPETLSDGGILSIHGGAR